MPISTDIPTHTGILNWDLTGEITWDETHKPPQRIALSASGGLRHPAPKADNLTEYYLRNLLILLRISDHPI